MRYLLLGCLTAYAVVGTGIRLLIPAPAAVAFAGASRQASEMQFFQDDSWIDAQGARQLRQEVFDGLFAAISRAQRLIVVDMFLFNAWQGPTPEVHRALSAELTQRLVARKEAVPDMQIVVISDPINTVYGGLPSVHFDALREAGIQLVMTKLTALQDSNPLWSGVWRLLMAPWGNSQGNVLPNPFGDGRVSVRSYFALLNFKANHRKLMVADNGDGKLSAMVSSANPHDGSSAHRNVALQFEGDAALDMLSGELALLNMSDASKVVRDIGNTLEAMSILQVSVDTAAASLMQGPTVRVLSESRIHEAVLELVDRVQAGDSVDLAMFYLSERQIVRSLIAAQRRGASVRVLLDVNNDAFGRQKNGVPNRPVAAELHAAGVDVRWCATSGEQCHAKWLHVHADSAHAFVMGSANFTRRNLLDFNLETNVLLTTLNDHPLANEMLQFFNTQWNNEDGNTYSSDYDTFADDSVWLKIQYRFMEFTGLSTF